MKFAVITYKNTVYLNSKQETAVRKSIRDLFTGMCEDRYSVFGLYDTKEQASAVADEGDYDLKLYDDQITLTTYWVVDAYGENDPEFDEITAETVNGVQVSIGDMIDGYSTINEEKVYQLYSEKMDR